MKLIIAVKITIASLLLVACTAAQMETAKRVSEKAGKISTTVLPVIAKVALAYGSPYANVLNAFTEAVIPGYDGGSETECYPTEQDADGNPDEDSYDEDADEYTDEDNYEENTDDYSDEGGYDENTEEYLNEDDYNENTDEYSDSQTYGDGSEDCYVVEESDDDSYHDQSYDEDYSEEEYYEEEQYREDPGSEPVSKLLAQVDVLREEYRDGKFFGTSVRDGDTLNSEDNYKVQIGCNTDCYVYIAQLDASGKMDPIMPSGLLNIQNPLAGNELHSLPSGDSWFFLDQNKGIETIYFIISQEPRKDIELIFDQLEAANKQLQTIQKISLDETMVMAKGIGGIRQGRRQRVQSSSGEEGTYVSTMLRSIDAELVLTRWFNHE